MATDFPASVGPEYNTLMALSAAISLLLIVQLGWRLLNGKPIVPTGWVAVFTALGAVMAFLGGVMTVTWPLKEVAPNCCQQDNIIFGEPILGFGVVLLTAAYLLWRTNRWWSAHQAAGSSGQIAVRVAPDDPIADEEFTAKLAVVLQPLSWFVFALGLALISIAFAGVRFKLYAAPPSEPISGVASGHPYVEAIFISILYALMGIGAVLLPFFLRTMSRTLAKVIGAAWLISGVVWLFFAAMNYYTHIGSLVKHTGRF